MAKCANCGTVNDELANYCKACGGIILKNYFDVLGIPVNAPYDTIKKAYLSAANKCHPDKTERLSPDLIKLASLKMAQLNDIWETLKDDASRTAYIASLYDEYKASSDRFSQDHNVHDSGNKGRDNSRNNSAHEADTSAERNVETNETTPWSRWFARTIDYTVFIAILITLVHLFSPPLIIWFHDFGDAVFADLDTGYFLFTIFLGFIACLFWVPIESLLLSTAGSTLGKWLLQVSVLDSAGEKLSYIKALQRSANVWLRGMACGVFVLSFFANYNAYRKLKADNISYWDDASGATVSHEKIGLLKFSVVLVFFMQSSFLVFLSWGTNPATKPPPEPLPVKSSASSQPTPAATASGVSGNDKTAAKNSTATQTPAPDKVKSPVTAPKATASNNTQHNTQNVAAAKTPSQSTQQNPKPAVNSPPSSSSPAAKIVKSSSSTPAATTVNIENTQDALLQAIPDEARKSTRLTQVSDPSSSGTIKVRASREQVIACMEAYFAIMHKAIDLPLGDYVRLNKQASKEKDRCLTGG